MKHIIKKIKNPLRGRKDAGKQRQRQRQRFWYHNFEMTGNLGQQQEQQHWQGGGGRGYGAAWQEDKKWSASAKWENDASLLSTVTQNVPKILTRIYDAQFPPPRRKLKKIKRQKKAKPNKFILQIHEVLKSLVGVGACGIVGVWSSSKWFKHTNMQLMSAASGRKNLPQSCSTPAPGPLPTPATVHFNQDTSLP